jgi:hypothetical protein
MQAAVPAGAQTSLVPANWCETTTASGYATASYYGKPVSGYVYVENMWGDQNYANTWWVQNRHGHWVFWTDRYSDGTQEYGQFLCFDDAAAPRGAVVTNNQGQVELNTTNIKRRRAEARTQPHRHHLPVPRREHLAIHP